MGSEHEKHTCRPQDPTWTPWCKGEASYIIRTGHRVALVAGPKVERGTQMLTAPVFSDILKGLQALYNAIHYFKRPKEKGQT